jgi:hypothetical protein
MKNLLLILLSVTGLTLFAQSSNMGKDATINPEIENLGGYKPNSDDLNPNQGGVFGPFGNYESTEGPSYQVIDDAERQEDEAGPRTLAQVTYSLYPNPATDYVVIELSERVTGSLQLLNLVGQAVISLPIDQSLVRLELFDVQPGVYFISIVSGEEKIVKKIKIQ